MEYPVHEAAALFPPMTSDDLAQLAEDIKRHGLRHPVALFKGSVLDGRNRLAACQAVGVTPRTVELPPDINPYAYVWSVNAERRHLPPGQKSAIYVLNLRRSDEWEKSKRARKKQANAKVSATKSGGKKKATVDTQVQRCTPVSSPAECPAPPLKAAIADQIGTSPRTVAGALSLANKRPDLLEKVAAGELTLPQAQRQARRDEKLAHLQAAPPANDASTWEIRCGDCLDELRRLESGCARLVFADPPYNIGIKYEGDGDQRSPDAYLAWCRAWMAECVRVLAPDGSFWLMINDEWADRFGVMLTDLGLHRRNWIKWYETFGVNCGGKFNRCSRHIFYTVKDDRRFVFHPEAVRRESARQSVYGDKRADPGGKTWDDVWVIPRLTGTCEERMPGFPTQVPLAVLRPIVGCASDPGDLVLDPFAGSGTTIAAAVGSGRRALGMERSRRYCDLARRRVSLAGSSSPGANGARRKATS